MDTLKTELRERCLQAPHWEQLLLQAFWYGLMSWLVTCAEDEKNPIEHRLSAKQIVTYADPEFESWPADYLEPIITKVIELHLSLEDLTKFFDELDDLFRDCIPTDLDIFTTFGNGELLTKEQWERLYAAVAFLPPPAVSTKEVSHNPLKHKTRRAHGRRGITPIRRRRGITHHHRSSINVVKMK
jgi:hypothetical protein